MSNLKIVAVVMLVVAIGFGDKLNTKLLLICVNCVSQPLFFAIKSNGMVECRPFPPLNKTEVFTNYVLHPTDCPLLYTTEVYTDVNVSHGKPGAIFKRQIQEGKLKESAAYLGVDGTWSTMSRDQPQTVTKGNGSIIDNIAEKLVELVPVPIPRNMTLEYRAGERLRKAMERAALRAQQAVAQVREAEKQLQKDVEEARETSFHLYHVIVTLGVHLIHFFN